MKLDIFSGIKIFAAAVIVAGMAACENGGDSGDGIRRSVSVNIEENEGNTISSTLVAPKDTTIMLSVQIDEKSSDNIIVKFKVDMALVAEYNEKNGTSYKMLPADAYTFGNREAILPRYNSKSSFVPITLKSGNMPDSEVYLLPVVIDEIKGNDNTFPQESSSVAYILFAKAAVPELQFIELEDIVLTTEVGPGKHNWFSAYLEPHVFDVTTAAANSEMMDFVLVPVNATTDTRFYGAQMGSFYGGQYATRIAPYTAGFEKLTFTGIGSPLHPGNDYRAIGSYDALLEYIESYRVSNNYDYKSKLDRMQSNALKPDIAIMITYGAKFNAQGYAMILIKNIQVSGGHHTVTCNVKYFEQDFRTEFNHMAIEDAN